MRLWFCSMVSGTKNFQKNTIMIELRKKANIALNIMTRISKNGEVPLKVLEIICEILGSDFGDIMEYIQKEE